MPTAGQRDLIAECTSCGRPFSAGSSGPGFMALGLGGQSLSIEHMQLRGDGTVNMQGVQVSCPHCGSLGRIPDGIYDFVRQGFRLLSRVSQDDAVRLTAVLRRYEQDQSDDDEVVGVAPVEARSFIQGVLARSDKKFWIGILLSLLIFIYQKYDSSATTKAVNDLDRRFETLDDQLHQLDENDRALIQQVSEILKELQDERVGGTPRSTPPTTSVNPPEVLPNKKEPCWCGSGRPYKRCHRRQP